MVLLSEQLEKTTDIKKYYEPKILEEPITTSGNTVAGTIRASIHKQGERNIVENIKSGLGYEGVVEPIVVDDYNGRVRADQRTVGCLTTNCGNDAPRNGWKIIEPNIRIRKLTPKECWRLMDFDDADIDKAKASGVSDSQLYKQAGNSIVVAVLENIFKQML